jgi:hypothetical protein
METEIRDELIEVLNNILESLAQLDMSNNNTKITDQLGVYETKANDVLRRARQACTYHTTKDQYCVACNGWYL